MAERSKARQVEYYDPDGNVQSGWYKDNRVYQDEAGTIPIPTGSTYQGDGGRYYRMTKYGDVLWSDPNRTDSDGHWIAQGNHWFRTAQDLMENMDIQYLAAQRLSDIVRAGLDEGKKPSEIEFGRFEKYKGSGFKPYASFHLCFNVKIRDRKIYCFY